MSKAYKIPVVWTMMGYIDVEADSLAEACKDVMRPDEPEYESLPEGSYLDESFGIDREGLPEQEDGLLSLDELPDSWFK